MRACIRLSWPDKLLNPNSRAHWAKKHQKQKAYKLEGWGEAVALGLSVREALAASERINVEIEFYPPDHRSRDEDNAVASLKYALDGISKGIGVDDSRFRISHRFMEPVKGGAVMIYLSGGQS